MLGHTLYLYLVENTDFQVDTLVFRSLLNEESVVCDVSDKVATESQILALKPDIIINCIGVLIGGSSSDAANAIYINGYFPHFLSSVAEKLEAKLIHISTDCVFSGRKGNYVETDFRDADDVYGRSKALGELDNQRDLTIRTSIIGPEIKDRGEGLLHWFLSQAGHIDGYTKAFWGGVTTLELSKAIVAMLSTDIVGVIHLTNGRPISKFRLLELFVEAFPSVKVSLGAVEGKAVDKSLRTGRNDIPFTVGAYEQMVAEMKGHMELHKQMYSSRYNI